jgi:hypothetical protein
VQPKREVEEASIVDLGLTHDRPPS